MVNQKLLDYVAQQLKNGVSQGAISAALIGAGWSEADVKEALQKSSTPVTAAAAAVTATPASVSTSPMQSTGPMVDGITNVSPAKSSVFGSAASGNMKPAMAAASGGRGTTIGLVVCSVLVVGLAVLSGYLYMQYSQAAADLAAATTAGNNTTASAQKMQQDLQAATADITTLKAQNASLAMEVKALAPAAAGTSATAEVQVAISGTLAQVATGYTITSPSGVVFTIRNAKDAAVEAALKDLVSKQVTIGGVHTPGSTVIKVVSLNGTAL